MGQFEWESSNLHISYPFEQPGIDGLNDLVADALVLDTVQSFRVFLRSLNISDWDSEGIAGEFVYADDTNFFESEPSVNAYSYGMWTVVVFENQGKQIQLILNNQRTVGYPISIFGKYPFVARVQECDPKAVTSIEVPDEDGYPRILVGDVQLVSGYNVQTQQQQASGVPDRPNAAAVVMDAVPGAGMGVSPSTCAPDNVLRSINTVGPDIDGKFVLNGLECYRCVCPSLGSPTPGVFDPIPATLKLCNDCGQCCKCTDYENVYKAIDRIYKKGSNSGLRLSRTIDDFNDLKNEIGSQKSRREIPKMDLLLRPAPGYIMGVQINLMNNWLRNSIYMNKDSMSSVLLKMFVTSPDVPMSSATILLKSCYLFNSAYGNPWIRVAKNDILLAPASLTDSGGIGIIVKSGIIANKSYHVISPTQYISLFFEIFWQTAGHQPMAGDKITVRLTSSTFRTSPLVKTDELVDPFTGEV